MAHIPASALLRIALPLPGRRHLLRIAVGFENQRDQGESARTKSKISDLRKISALGGV
ncbi:hypothetical protein [Opitutus sp. ER46]|uniref:hypothetical protein n=1 Tax=Opitutus sp. ER46 TaxID=2161864 RepID=UPI0013047D79|nr:hypothetical protein [Opitutus sp. ER46]